MKKLGVISIINEKGGVGKSTICMNMAHILNADYGYSVCVIDMDGQNANLTYIAGIQKPDNLCTIKDLIWSKATLDETIIHQESGIDVIPANILVNNLTEQDSIQKYKAVIKALKERYDVVLIDVGPSPNRSQFLSLATSDYLICPVLADPLSLAALKGLYDSIQEMWEGWNQNLKIAGIVFNMYDGRLNVAKETLAIAEKMAKSMKTKVFAAKIRKNKSLSEYVFAHEPVISYDPSGNATKDLRALVKEFLTDIGEVQ